LDSTFGRENHRRRDVGRDDDDDDDDDGKRTRIRTGTTRAQTHSRTAPLLKNTMFTRSSSTTRALVYRSADENNDFNEFSLSASRNEIINFLNYYYYYYYYIIVRDRNTPTAIRARTDRLTR
jgi:hypothetical protein